MGFFDMLGDAMANPTDMCGYPAQGMNAFDYPYQNGMPMQAMPMQSLNQGYPAVVGVPQGYPTGVYCPPSGYGVQGAINPFGMVKYSRQQMLEGLRNYVIMANQGRVPISKEEKLEETPQLLRHACAECGISYLQMLTFDIPEAGIRIPFYFCTACGKLYYYKDFAV